MTPRNPRAQSALDPTRYTPHFAHRGGHLYCEGVALDRVAEQVGTPAYVYSRASIEEAYQRLDRALRGLPHTLCYAMKANSNLALLKLLARLGSGFDIVSGGELYRLERISVPGHRIVFSGVGKTREEIRAALHYLPAGERRGHRRGILLFNVESAAEVELLAEEAARVVARGGRPAAAAIRVNPDVEAGGHPHISTGHSRHKFGVDWGEARKLYLSHRHSPWIAWRGVSAHIGSQILSLKPFRHALHRLGSFVRQLRRDGVALKFLDFGGGVGVRYVAEKSPDVAVYARAITRDVKALGCHLLLEPGRVLVGPAGVLLTRVLYTKANRGKTFVVVDAAMNDFLRPALYGAEHPVTRAAQPDVADIPPLFDLVNGRQAGPQRVDVVGPVCETGDFLARDRPLEPVRSGELLVVWGAGAYGFVAASNYNSRPRPAEVLIEGSRFRVIRRRESLADLIRGE